MSSSVNCASICYAVKDSMQRLHSTVYKRPSSETTAQPSSCAAGANTRKQPQVKATVFFCYIHAHCRMKTHICQRFCTKNWLWNLHCPLHWWTVLFKEVSKEQSVLWWKPATSRASVMTDVRDRCHVAFSIQNNVANNTYPFNGPLSGTTQVSRYQKDKTNLDFTDATDKDWQWHQLGHMQVYTSLQTDNHASTRPLNF